MSDDTVTIDGKNYLKSDIISKCSPVKPVVCGSHVRIGDRFLIEREEYIVACLNSRELQLIGLHDGNRWSDATSKNYMGAAQDLEMFSGSEDEAKRVTK